MSNNKHSVSEEFPQANFQRYLQHIVAALNAQLAEIPERQRMDILIRDDALYRIGSEFEFIYRIIFGSQIELLKKMTSINLSTSEMMSFFDTQRLKRQIPSDITFDSWIAFLLQKELIEKDTSSNKKSPFEGIGKYLDEITNIYKINDKGISFLLYLKERGYDDKPNLI